MSDKADLESYMQMACRMNDLTIAEEFRGEVLATLERTMQIAAPLLTFDLPEDSAEAAPVFVPAEVGK